MAGLVVLRVLATLLPSTILVLGAVVMGFIALALPRERREFALAYAERLISLAAALSAGRPSIGGKHLAG